MLYSNKTRVRKFSHKEIPNSRRRHGLNHHDSTLVKPTTKIKYITLTIVSAIVVVGILATAIIVPIVYSMNASNTEKITTINETTPSKTTTSTTATTSTTTSATTTTTSTTTTTTSTTTTTTSTTTTITSTTSTTTSATTTTTSTTSTTTSTTTTTTKTTTTTTTSTTSTTTSTTTTTTSTTTTTTSTTSTTTSTTTTTTSTTTSKTTTTTTTTTSTTTTTTTLTIQWNATGATLAGSSAATAGATASLLNYIVRFVFDSSNALYMCDFSNNRIQKWASGASSGVTVAGQANGASGTSTSSLYNPAAIILDSGNNMYITDYGNHRLLYWANGASSGSIIAGTTGVAGTANNQFNNPSGLYRDSTSGTMYIADLSNHRIMQYLSGASSGTIVAGTGVAGTASTQLSSPQSVHFDSSSNSFIIVNFGAHNIVRWVLGASSWTLLAGSATGTSGSTATLLSYPLDVAFDSFGNIYVTDLANHRIQFFYAGQPTGITIAGITSSAGTTANQLNRPHGLLVDSQYNLYVADTSNNRLQKFSRY